MITFFVQGHPVPWQRAGRHGYQTFTPRSTRVWQTTIAWAAKLHRPKKLFIGPLSMCLCFYFERPQSIDKEIIYCIGRSDVDNYAKSVMDALHHIFYNNDNQVVDLTATKFYGDPGVNIVVEEVI